MQNKINFIQTFLKENSLDCIILKHGNKYFCEEVLECEQIFKWLTGISVSYGYIIISQTDCALFVDGRYILVTETTLANTNASVHNIKQTHPFNWVAENIAGNIGIDPDFFSINEIEALNRLIKPSSTLKFCKDLFSNFWKDRPSFTPQDITPHPIEYSGEDARSKISSVTKIIQSFNADGLLVCDPCDVAWLLNIRGQDLKHTPIVLAQMLLFADGTYRVYTDAKSKDIEQVFPAEDLEKHLSDLALKLIIDPANTVFSLKLSMNKQSELIPSENIVAKIKSKKNQIELTGARNAHVEDGVAIVSMLAWLNQEIKAGTQIFERDISEKIQQFRRRCDLYVSDSFKSIVAFGQNSANVHYDVIDRGSPISQDGLLLLDTGGQYKNGTTDVSRTMCFGWPTQQQQDAYTRVLKGHIHLSSTVFPAGTTGRQIDAFARQYLWQVGLDYDHGTGHGIGSYLNVHEGPTGFSKKLQNDTPLIENSLVTIEPGYYLKNNFGIRIENVNQIIALTDDEPKFLTFASLTLVPMDFKMLIPALLTESEKIWLKKYHSWVLDTLSNRLDEKTKEWLIREINPYFNVI